jgi:predicted Zn-dependent protease
VAYVHPRLPAALAGLAVADVIVQINTVNVREDPADKVGHFIERLTRAKIQPLQLDIMRGEASHTIMLSAVPACHYAMQVLDTDILNAITDGSQIGVTRGALQFFTLDDELGWLVAHEIAHNILSHVQDAKLQAMLRTFLTGRGEGAGASATMPPRPSLESQADYVGAYLMARAGYDLSAIKRVWERLERLESRQGGKHPELADTHPPTKERSAAFEVTLKEIREKQEAGEKLFGPHPPINE